MKIARLGIKQNDLIYWKGCAYEHRIKAAVILMRSRLVDGLRSINCLSICMMEKTKSASTYRKCWKPSESRWLYDEEIRLTFNIEQSLLTIVHCKGCAVDNGIQETVWSRYSRDSLTVWVSVHFTTCK